ncbi:olfactory receptor 1038-like [Perognathus longimembris pacificus]|uniref:olfactory receptor 1038-like n=1 Tax=Perognathus longimembris pacificus TaxID=214514 RepID=UPI0020196967|nr:olfactory receptor 1038-like [Perognathus longimembris pacificus]
MKNETTVTEFILKGFSDMPEMKLISTLFFLFIYLFALLGNISIIAAVTIDIRLHTPMYFFLKNLSFLDMCYTSVTVPKALANSLIGTEAISFGECVTQLFLFVMMCASECFLLTSMAYDRCLAIHRPLVYGVIMSRKLCTELVIIAWLSGALYAIFHTVNTFSVIFCGPNIIDHFFCDSTPIMRLSCSDYHMNEEVGFAVGGCIILSAFTLTIISYVLIISTIAQIHSANGRQKAFSTCSSHLATVVLFYVTGSFTYLRPTSQYSPTQGRVLSVFYSILTPSLNPLVYCLRNRDMHMALKKLFGPSK